MLVERATRMELRSERHQALAEAVGRRGPRPTGRGGQVMVGEIGATSAGAEG